MKRSHYLSIWFCLFCFCTWGASGYTTVRLQAMASLLPISGIDTLSFGEYSQFSYKKHPLIIRVNSWNEIEHIGLKLFAQEMKDDRFLPIYDFLERYLLELNLAQEMEEKLRLMRYVTFQTGNPSDALLIDETDKFSMTYQSLRSYQVEWTQKGKTILSIQFDMDYQLLSGCNLIELEQNYRSNLLRYQADSISAHPAESDFTMIQDSADYHILKGTFFVNDAIRNDLYLKKENNEWKLISDIRKPYQSIANSLLSEKTEGDYKLSVTFDLYGYQEIKDTIQLSNWLSFGKKEGCTSYFGMKSKTESAYSGTLFMVNETCGFMHLLSVTFPTASLAEKEGFIEGRLFVYIPLHNVSEKLFYHTDFKNIDDENEILDSVPVTDSDSGNR